MRGGGEWGGEETKEREAGGQRRNAGKRVRGEKGAGCGEGGED